MGRVLLLYNSPRVHRYFSALASHIPSQEFVVHRISLRLCRPPPPASTIEEIIEFGMRRKRARRHYGAGRLAFFRLLYSTAARLHYNHAASEMDNLTPDAVGVWSGNALDVMAVVVAARDRGTPCVRFENGYLPNTTQMDLQGVNVASSVPRDPEFYRHLAGASETGGPARLAPRKPHRSKQSVAPIALPARFVFVPFQVQLDSQVLLHSPWIQRMQEFFAVVTESVQRLGAAAPDVVFKEHPSCPSRYPELHRRAQDMGGVHFANGNSTEELIRGALGVITLNSTVGLEALLLGKPVLALGNAVFEIPGVAASTRSIEGITEWLGTVTRGQPPPSPLRKRFLRFLSHDYLIPDRHQNPGPTHFAAVAERLRRIGQVA